ncbi:unnamed protein product [Leptosia nina]|uniref:BTB domain-containing protein n=1 Tax=Leptosia nina TaxID=320188 RepID=A0AAV1JI37_9NEOP
MENIEFVMDNFVIHGHQPCQSHEAKYLCIDNIYEKLQRPNYYDIGGTYSQESPDYWFVCKTELIGEIFLIHIFVLVICLWGRQLYIAISFTNKKEEENDEGILDFSSLLDDPVVADFTVESEDGATFRVHKVLLMAHSEVFRAMLKEDTAESKNNHVKLVDVSKDDLHHLLTYIYSGTLKNIENINFFNMLILADRFNLVGLRELSEHALIQQIAIDNALEMLAVADSYNSPSLKTASLVFIKKNKSTLQNTIFDELDNAELIRELCKFLVA